MAMGFLTLVLLLITIATTVNCNIEGNALHSWRVELDDPYGVLQSWDPTFVNPCSWFHVTCNKDNAVIRVDLGNAGLSGPLVPQLGLLSKLQYLEVFGNKINGVIPSTIGNLTELISLGLENNRLSGYIPSSLGNLRSSKYLRLQGNNLKGNIPMAVIQLVHWGNLRILNVSDNQLAGTIRKSNARGFAITTIVQDPIARK